MKLATFRDHEELAWGLVEESTVYPLSDSDLPPTLHLALEAGLDSLAGRIEAARSAAQPVPLDEVELAAPIAKPGKFLAIGLNYRDHIEETGRTPPEFPVFFNKQTTCVNGPFDPIHYPAASEAVDYEGELGMVIGKRGRHISYEQAKDHIAGYLIVNDVSARDWQRRAPTMTLGKSFDTHGPIGPWLVTPDELGDPHDRRVRTWLNGELRQDYSTSQMVFDCYRMIEILSTVCTLEPGDIISAGTGSGVGVAMDPPAMMKVGDRVRIEIDHIGSIESEVVAEPDAPSRGVASRPS